MLPTRQRHDLMIVVFAYNGEFEKRYVGKRLQVYRLAVLELSTCKCEMFIRKCYEEDLKDDIIIIITAGKIGKYIQIQ